MSDSPKTPASDTTTTVPSESEFSVSQDTFQSLWSEARARFKRQTGTDPAKHELAHTLASCQTANDICLAFERKVRVLQTTQTSHATWRKLRDSYVKPAVEVILLLNEAFSETAGYFPIVPGGKIIFVAFGALLLATKGMSERTEALMALFEEIQYFLDSLRVRTVKPENWGAASRNIASVILAHLLDVFVIAIKYLPRTQKNEWWRIATQFGQSLMGNKDMQSALQRLRALTALEVRAIAAETRVDAAETLDIANKLLKETQAMKLTHTHDVMSVSILEESICRLVERQSEVLKRAEDERQQSLRAQEDTTAAFMLARLERVDLADISAQTRNGCLKGTRVGVLKTLSLWARDLHAPRLYWLNGMAGTGKSAVARSFCWLLRDEGLLGGSFFCSRGASAEQMDVKCIVPTLAHGLASQDHNFKGALMAQMQRYASEPRPKTWDIALQFERLLVEPFAALGDDVNRNFVLLVDALDETEDETVRELLSALMSASPQIPCKFFLTSRPESYIRSSMGSLSSILRLHDIEADIVEADISLYIDDGLRKIKHERLPSAWPPIAAMQRLSFLAGGLFIYAFTALEYIRGNPVERLEKLTSVTSTSDMALDRPVAIPSLPDPKTSLYQPLDNIYNLILSEALNPTKHDVDECELTVAVLGALLASRDVMTVNTFSSLLGIDASRLRSSLDSLHAVIYIPAHDDRGTVSPFHASFGDFLSSPGRGPWGTETLIMKGHRLLATICVTIMASGALCFNLCGSTTSYLKNDIQKLPAISPTVKYVCMHWSFHLAASDSEGICLQFEEMFVSPKFLFWLEALTILDFGLFYAREVLQRAQDCTHLKISSPRLAEFLLEAISFLQRLDETIQWSTPHIYLSVLPFLDSDSLMATACLPHFSRLPSITVREFEAIKFCRANDVYPIAISKDSALIASGWGDGTVNIWDSDSAGQRLMQIDGHESSVSSVVISPDGTRIVSGSYDGQIRCWELIDGGTVRMLWFTRGGKFSGRGLTCLDFSPDGSRIASGTMEGYLGIWSARTGQLLTLYCSLPNPMTKIRLHGFPRPVYDRPEELWHDSSCITVVRYSPDGNLIAYGTQQGQVIIADARTCEPKGQPILCYYHDDVRDQDYLQEVHGLCFSQDGLSLLIHSSVVMQLAWTKYETIDTLRVWKVRPRTPAMSPVHSKRHKRETQSYGSVFLGDGSVIAQAGPDGIIFRDGKTGEVRQDLSTLKGPGQYSVSLVSEAGGMRLVSSTTAHGAIYVWDIGPTSIENCRSALNDDHFHHFFLPDIGRPWLGGPEGEHMLWFPSDLVGIVQHPPCSLILGNKRVTVDWTDPVHGSQWTKCYTPKYELVPPSVVL